jgi:hypothetical protein
MDQKYKGFCLSQPNETRLSCGALKKNSFRYLSATVSFERLLGARASELGTDGTNTVGLISTPTSH